MKSEGERLAVWICWLWLLGSECHLVEVELFGF